MLGKWDSTIDDMIGTRDMYFKAQIKHFKEKKTFQISILNHYCCYSSHLLLNQYNNKPVVEFSCKYMVFQISLFADTCLGPFRQQETYGSQTIMICLLLLVLGFFLLSSLCANSNQGSCNLNYPI